MPVLSGSRPSARSNASQESGRKHCGTFLSGRIDAHFSPLRALLWINNPETLDDLETTVVCLGDVHVHANVMLTGHHFSRTTRPLGDLCVVESLDDILLLQRACFFHSSLPELQTTVQA